MANKSISATVPDPNGPSLQPVVAYGRDSIGTARAISAGGDSFDVVLAPATTNGAYSAGDIMGGWLEIPAGRYPGGKITLQSINIMLKAAVTPTFTVHLFSEAMTTPANFEDNDAYSLPAADCFKWRGSITGFTLTDHGTPNSYAIHNLARILTTDAAQDFYAVVVDAAGVTLTSTSDMQIRFTGYQD